MSILLRHVNIIDPSSPFHQQQTDILIENGFIKQIGQVEHKADRVIEIDGLHASPGWLDVFSNFCDPGFEHKETLETGATAAAFGGYTDVMITPNTNPCVHNKAAVEYIVQRSKTLPVSIYPIGAATKNAEGKELAEMYDMHQSGAAAFGDGTCTIQSSGLLLKALQYVKAINKAIIQLPNDKTISPHGLMNESIISTRLGLPGQPSIAEELMITRDIELTRYAGSKMHFTGITSAKAVELIRQAKKEGVDVTCSVSPAHLYFTEDDLFDYDTNLKLNPPLRSKADREALINGLIDGTIDCIATHHLPQDIDNKISEFEYAKHGMIGLETSFAVLKTVLPDLPIEKLIDLLCTRPRKIFNLPVDTIRENTVAKLTLFLPNEEWHVKNLHSKSNNSAFIGKTLKGKPLGIINKDKVFLNPSS